MAHLSPRSWKPLRFWFITGPRKAAEEKASKKYLQKADLQSYQTHPLATTKLVTIDMEYDDEAKSFVTYVKELHDMSTFGATEHEALDNTAEMIRGYIKSMESNRKRIPLATSKLAALKQLTGIR